MNVIAALASDGEVYTALLTSNVDSDVMMMFMTHLASVLTKESPGFRDDTVFLLDGVSQKSLHVTLFKLLGGISQVCRDPCVLSASRHQSRAERPI